MKTTVKKTTKEISRAASLLGRMGRGVPRKLSEEERIRRRDRLAAFRPRRWPSAKTKGKDRA